VHILINNAAIAMGKRVDELKLDEVKVMMDTNFIAYTQFMIMFLA
jgi:all-trans-retinol dehydrogenase (NAD+)